MRRHTLRLALLAALLAPGIAAAETAPVWLLSWGSLGHTDGQFEFPNDVCVDAAGSVYVADYHHHTIKKFDPNGNFLMKFGFPGTGAGGMDGCWSVGVDASGFVYVADVGNDLIQQFKPDGGWYWQWRLPPATDTTTSDLVALDVSPAGDVYATDQMNNLHQFTSAGIHVRSWPIDGVRRTLSTYLPEVAVAPNGDVYAYDRDVAAMRHFDGSGNFLGELHASGVSDGWIGGETGFTVDPLGQLWTSAGDEVRKFDAAGSLLTRWGTTGTGPGQFKGVNGVAVTPGGFVYVADKNNHRIQKFGFGVTAARSTTWGRLKALYR